MRFSILSILFFVLTALTAELGKPKPTLFVIGDSTVKNGGGRGADGLWGWGDFLKDHFDTTRIRIENHARGGRSSRTYITEGLWDNVLERAKPGDFVILQFGHNDAGKINDSTRARGTIRGTGEEMEEIDNIITGKHEVVHTYGWYIRKYITDARAKGITPIVCSLIPRNRWENGKVIRASDDYGKWAAEAASAEKAFFLDLNNLVADRYDQLGDAEVKDFFKTDHTHTNEAGARLNAAVVSAGIETLKKCPLRKYVKKNEKS